MKALKLSFALACLFTLGLPSFAQAQDKPAPNSATESEHSGPNGAYVGPLAPNSAVQSEHSGPNGGVLPPPGGLGSGSVPAPSGPQGGYVPLNDVSLEVSSLSPGHGSRSLFNIDLRTGNYTVMSASDGAAIGQTLESMGTLTKGQLKEVETALDAVKAAKVQGTIPGTSTAPGAPTFSITWSQGLDPAASISGPANFTGPSGMGPHNDVLTAWDSVVPLLDRMKKLEAKAIKDNPYKPILATVEDKSAKGLPAPGSNAIDTVTKDRGNTAPVVGNAGETGPAKPGFSTADPVPAAIRDRGATGPRTGLGQALEERMADAGHPEKAGEK